MKILNYEIRKVLPEKAEIKHGILEQSEQNAIRGVIQAELELKHHELLLEEAPGLDRTEEEVKGYEQAIERDKKTINNWATQIRAIKHEQRNN